jgi:hypothetical protein
MSDSDIALHSRPPRKGQFQPGQSGNTKGRPKGSRNIRTHVFRLLEEKIPVIEGGKTRKIPRAEAIAIQLVNLASKGDPKGLAAVMNLTRAFDQATDQSRPRVWSKIEDKEVIKAIIERIRAGDPSLSADLDGPGQNEVPPEGAALDEDPEGAVGS